MKKNIYTKIKTYKPFEFNDIFLYSFILLLVFVLFLCFVIVPQTKQAVGFSVEINDKKVFSLNYSTREYIIENDFIHYIEVDKEQNTVIIFLNDEKTEFNKLLFDANKKTIKMLETTCSNTKDCLYEPEISKTGIIYCAPHKLKVLPINNEFTPSPPVIGGDVWKILH